MKARKIAYIIALIAVELLTPGNGEAAAAREVSAESVILSKEDYRDLLQDQMRLRMVESGELIIYSDDMEALHARLDEVQAENERLKSIGSEEPVQERRYSIFHPGISISSGLAADFDKYGAYLDCNYRFCRKWGVSAGISFLDGVEAKAGITYHL